MCSHFPNTFSRGTVQKFRGTLVCRGTPFENPCYTPMHNTQGKTIAKIKNHFQNAYKLKGLMYHS